jgi:hypothetical protein
LTLLQRASCRAPWDAAAQATHPPRKPNLVRFSGLSPTGSRAVKRRHGLPRGPWNALTARRLKKDLIERYIGPRIELDVFGTVSFCVAVSVRRLGPRR